MDPKMYDLIVIGAGPTGLATARAYLQFHPDHEVALLEALSTLGGTWAKERLYKDLKTNNLYGTFEFPDFPMSETEYDISKGKNISGPTVHRYLSDYAEAFGISDRIIFKQTVTGLEKAESGGWLVSAVKTGTSEGSVRSYHTEKLIIASGLTSEPNIPAIPGAAEFEGQMFHVKEFGYHTSDVHSDSRVVVLGGGKSAYDAVYSYASTGHQIDWVVRPGGRGPIWMAPSYVTPLKLWLEQLVSTRFLTWLVPCTWGHADGYSWPRWFLHETRLGRLVGSAFAKVMDGDLTDLAGYDKHESTRELKPWYSSLKVGANLSILNYPTDIFEYVRSGQVKVHVADVERLSQRTVHISTGQSFEADTLFYATGWNIVPKFLAPFAEDFGIVRDPSRPDLAGQNADKAILSKYPYLASQQSPSRPSSTSQSPQAQKSLDEQEVPGINQDQSPTGDGFAYRLHRFLVPPKYFDERSVVIASACHSLRTLTQAYVASLWTVAYLDGLLAHQQPSKSGSTATSSTDLASLEYEAALHAHSGKWTSPGGYAPKVPDIVFQHVPWLDLLLADLGVQRWRKLQESRSSGGWFAGLRGQVREIFEPYMPSDYRGVMEEWAAKHRKTQ